MDFGNLNELFLVSVCFMLLVAAAVGASVYLLSRMFHSWLEIKFDLIYIDEVNEAFLFIIFEQGIIRF